MSDEVTRTQKIIVSIEEIVNWLGQGVTRYPSDSAYNSELGSVQEKYGLTPVEARSLFKDARLRNLKVSRPSRVLISEDMDGDQTEGGVQPIATSGEVQQEPEPLAYDPTMESPMTDIQEEYNIELDANIPHPPIAERTTRPSIDDMVTQDRPC